MDATQKTPVVTRVRGACPHDCPDTCALIVTVEDGRAIRVAGDPEHPTTHGALCTKVTRYPERTYSADRILRPMRRAGPKGAGRFEPVSWDEAIRGIAARLQAVAAVDPRRILPYNFAGTMGLVQGDSISARFFNRLGAARLDRTICSSPGKTALQYTLGAAVGMDVEDYVESDLILLWGTNSITSNLHFWTFAQAAKRRGARLVAIDPYRTATAEKCHEHVALRPGTDAALAFGLIASLERQRLLDEAYVADHVHGAEALFERARAWTPDRVAATCGIAAEVVDRLARDYGTRKPAAIRLNYGMQRVRGGGNAARAIATLPALVGAWRERGGGLLLSSSGEFEVDWTALQRPDLLPEAQRAAQGLPPTINMSTIGDALAADAPRIEAVIVYNSNPVAVAPDSNRVIDGFSREDLFTVVLDHFQTDTADYADYLLPATTQLEHLDIHVSYGHRYWVMNEPAVAPVGECLPNTEIFRRLARAMGFDEPCFSDTDRMIAAQAIDRSGRDTPRALRQADGPIRDEADARARLAPFAARGWLKLERDATPFAHGGFPTPSGKVEAWSDRLAAEGFDPLPDHLPNHECVESDPQLAARYPLALITPPARHFLNSSFANVASLRKAERDQQAHLHPVDAARFGIADGATVVVHNDRGEFRARAVVTEACRPGLVMAPGLWWHRDTDGGRNVNSVTHQRLTDLGRGPSFYDCLVGIRVDARRDLRPGASDDAGGDGPADAGAGGADECGAEGGAE